MLESTTMASSLSIKSCNKCHEIYKHLQNHITLEHIPDGPEWVISNVIVNLLSLLIPDPQMGKFEEINKPKQLPPSQNVPIPVIAKQPEKQTVASSNAILPIRAMTALPSFSQQFSSNKLPGETTNITNRFLLQQDVLPRIPCNTNLAGKKHQKQQQQSQQHQRQRSQNNLQKQQQQQRFSLSPPKQIANSLQLNNLELQPVLIQQIPESNAVNNQQVNGLVNPDGSLTPSGLSLLLSYQSGRGDNGGKTEIDDIADILVNKMPIPSLKGLDPANFQLSTFYLQQFALNYLQQAIGNTSTSVTGVSTIDNVNLCLSPNSSGGTDYSFNKDVVTSSVEGKNADVQNTNANVDGSDMASLKFHEVLARHKHFNELITAWDTTKSQTHKTSDLEHVHLPSVQNMQPVLQSSAAPQIVPEPHILRPTTNSQIALSKTTKDTEIPSSELARKPATVNVTQYVQSHPTLFQVGSIGQQQKHKPMVSSDESSSHVDFTHEKSSSNDLPAVHSTVHGLQSLIVETAKRIAMDSTDAPKTATTHLKGRNVVSVAVAPSSDSKSAPITTLQGIMVETPPKDDHVSIDAAPKSDNIANRGERTHSSMSMVSLNDYSSIDDEDDNEQAGSFVQQGDKLLYKCVYCGVTFSVLSTLHNHVKSVHSEENEFCNYCQLTFTDPEEYYAHVTSHRGEDNIYTCHFCTKIFTSHGDFKKHLAKHTQKRPYMCEHCQKTFRDPGSLAKHERIHTGEQPFVCNICSRGFAEKSSLRKHTRVHSGEKPYKCEQCDKSFSISGNLQRHILIHTGKKPFKCTLCIKAFNNPSHLRRHVKNLHNKNDDKNTPTSSSNGKSTKMDVNNLVVPRASMMETEPAK